MGLNRSLHHCLIAVLMLTAFWGCAKKPPAGPPVLSPAPADRTIARPDGDAVGGADPARALAALELNRRAEVLMAGGAYDRAITLLERALMLNPDNVRHYYFLAEIWLKKGNPDQAAEFNRMARQCRLPDDEWAARVGRQARLIELMQHP